MSPTPPNAPSLAAYLVYKTVGLVVFTALLPIILIYRVLRHLVPSLRPFPTWSLQRDLAIAGGRLYLSWTHRFSLPRPEGKAAWQPQKLVHRLIGQGTDVKVVEIPPASRQYISGFLAVADGIVVPEKVPGFWTYPKSAGLAKGDEDAKPNEKVMMYIAGGSWVMGHPMGTPFPYYFCTATDRRVLSVNHRKCLTADSAFPAPMQDALAGYLYLISRGFQAHNITLIGDSSGAHLMLGLARYLAEWSSTEHAIGMPGALMLVSPSTDLSFPPPPSISTDFLVPYINNRAYPSMSRHYSEDALVTNPYFSAAVAGSLEFLAQAQQEHGLQIFVQHGTAELITPGQQKLVEKLRKDGVQFELDVIEGGAHLDAGIAFALLERKPESSWVRLLEAVKRITA